MLMQCMNYPWGKSGQNSLSARLCAGTPNPDFAIEDEKEYAEMWMGDYPVLPAKVLETGEELHKVIDKRREELLGKDCAEKFGGVLPFLPKILSIQKALPLQIHPNKELAARLHASDPSNFTDPNHKPEIAVALGDFEVFAGWKPLPDIRFLFGTLPPLKKFLPNQDSQHIDDGSVREICRRMLEANEESVRDTQDALARMSREDFGQQAYFKDLLPRLQEQYSNDDAGTLVALLLMNFLSLSAHDALYVPADAPHAYLSGDIVECMARSNNVLNTGFCPRADRDSIPIFTAALTFASHSSDDLLLPSQKCEYGSRGKTREWKPPLSEFAVMRTRLGLGEEEVTREVAGPSVLWAVEGAGTLRAEGREWAVKEGYVFFVGCGVEVGLKAQGERGLDIYRAYAE
ncbi:hypothetical protein MMC22_001630 [Lobaria immixta]|nr:hypothetical protein [Lobaria immixta]